MGEKAVAKRKTHTKSRKGCFQCKQRHTKCNEEHPRCSNCVRLDIHCNWPTRPNGFSSTSPGTDESIINGHHTIISPGLASSSELALADLRLLHHWTSKTYRSLSNHPTKVEVWQNDFIEIAFEHPFLLHGFLALAALHKVVSEPQSDKQSLLAQADSHISSALGTYRKNLEYPTLETAIPMFLLASVLITYNFGSAQLERPDDTIGAIHHCFRLLQGVKVVINPHWHEIKSSKVFAHLAGPTSLLESLDPRQGDDDVQEVLQLKDLVEGQDAQDKEAFIQAIEDLHRTFIRVRKCNPEQDEYKVAWIWPATLEDHFLNLISIHNPIAAIIVSHFAVLLAQVRPVWWVHEWPQRIVIATRQLLADSPELLKSLDWPSQILNPAA